MYRTIAFNSADLKWAIVIGYGDNDLGREEVVEESLSSRVRLLGFFGGAFLLEPLLFEKFLSAEGLRIWIETEEDSLVHKGILLLCPGSFLDFLPCRPNNGLDLVTVDNASDVGVRDLGRRENVVLLIDSRLVERSEHLVQQRKGTLRPDHKSAEMSTRGQLQQVQSSHINEFNTRKVPEGLDHALIFAVNNKGTASLPMSAVPKLAFASS